MFSSTSFIRYPLCKYSTHINYTQSINVNLLYDNVMGQDLFIFIIIIYL